MRQTRHRLQTPALFRYAEFVKANQARMQGLVDKKRKSTPKATSSASKKKAKKSEVQIATDHSVSKLERQISVLEKELSEGSQIKRLIDQAENALSRADEDIQNAKDEVKSTLDSFSKRRTQCPMKLTMKKLMLLGAN